VTVLGVDLGIRKIAVAVITDGVSGYTLYGVPRLVLTKQRREVELHKLATFLQAVSVTYDPDYVFIEKPIIGNNRKYSMQISEVCGAVMGGLGLADSDSTPKVDLVDNKTWKSELLANGNASKEEVQNYIIETHPAYAAFCGEDQDAFDACCIALYGCLILDRAKRLSL
jgi:Holliday junction resolvasome RuvABC endonuclease subunit